MRIVICGLLAMVSFTWGAAAYAGDDATAPLEHDRIDIRSMQDPNVSLLAAQPVSVALPAHPTIADKQLLQLIKDNLIAEGYTITTPDKSTWTVTGTVSDQPSMLAMMDGATLTTSTIRYVTIAVVVYPNNDQSSPVWSSSVYAFDYFWMNEQEPIVRAILATYGVDFYYKNEDPKDVLNHVKDKKHRPTPPTLDEIKHCVANPKADGC